MTDMKDHDFIQAFVNCIEDRKRIAHDRQHTGLVFARSHTCERELFELCANPLDTSHNGTCSRLIALGYIKENLFEFDQGVLDHLTFISESD